MRAPQRQGDQLTWQDSVQKFAPSPTTLRLAMDRKLLATVQQFPKVNMALEADLSMMPTLIRERGAGIFPFMFMVVETTSGMILAGDLLHPTASSEEMWSDLPLKLVRVIARLRTIPAEIRVRSPLLSNCFSRSSRNSTSS